jgi:hypothetical protein
VAARLQSPVADSATIPDRRRGRNCWVAALLSSKAGDPAQDAGGESLRDVRLRGSPSVVRAAAAATARQPSPAGNSLRFVGD